MNDSYIHYNNDMTSATHGSSLVASDYNTVSVRHQHLFYGLLGADLDHSYTLNLKNVLIAARLQYCLLYKQL